MRAFKTFIETFKHLRLSFIWVLGFELLFFLLVAGLFLATGGVLGEIGREFSAANPFLIQQQSTDALRTFFIQSVAAIILLFFCVFIVYCALQGFSWLAVTGKKPTLGFFTRFFLLNTGWLIGWFIVEWFVIVGLRSEYAVIGATILAVLFIHLTGIMQLSFMGGKTIKQSIGSAFSIGFGQIHRFILPYLLALIVFLVWSQVWLFIPVESTGGFALVALCCVVFAPFLAWYKFYLHRLLKSIEN